MNLQATAFPAEEFLLLIKNYSEKTMLKNLPQVIGAIGTIVIWFMERKKESDPSEPDAPEVPLIRSPMERASIESLADVVGIPVEDAERIGNVPAGGLLDSILAKQLQQALLKMLSELLEQIKDEPEKYLQMLFDAIADLVKAFTK